MGYVHKNKSNRVSFSKIPSLVEMPDFLSLQKDSFERFLQLDTLEDERDHMGLEGVFQDVFPLEDSHRNYILEYNNYFLVSIIPKESDLDALCFEFANYALALMK